MARRKNDDLLGNFFRMLLDLPWWFGPIIAVLVYRFLRFLLASTYLGGKGDEINGPDTLSVGKDGSVLITSGWGTTSPDYPVTAGCFQPSIDGKNNAVFSLLSNNLGALLYSTFMGGQGANLRANAFGPDGSI